MRYIVLIGSIVLAMLVALSIGRFSLSLNDIWQVFMGEPASSIHETIIYDIRLPRIIAAFFIGASLAVAGTAFQSLFRNPLVGPNILGVAAGSGFGAALMIILFESLIWVQFGAFGFGLLAVTMTYFIGSRANKKSILVLVLSGIIVGAIFSALISLIKYAADPEDKLPTIVYWLMGSLSGTSWNDLLFLIPISFIGILILYLLRWKINILSTGEEQAIFLGERVKFLTAVIIVSATVITSASVATCGIVGWVGLLIPHIARMVFGANHLSLIPSSVLIGGLYMIVVDTVARSVTAAEIPLSILTALIGAPLIGALLMTKGKKWF